MEGHVFPDQEQLLQFLRRLKEVFDVCDEDADGFIRVEHLVDLGLQFGQGDEVKALSRYLDPNADGKINFKDFCHGVFAIKGCEEILKMAVGPRSVTSNQPSVTDNGYIYQNGEARLGALRLSCVLGPIQSAEAVRVVGLTGGSPRSEDDNRTNGFSDLGSSPPQVGVVRLIQI
ncbi:rab11 family-interacting protein 4A-like isoform X1 [Lates japonicus]|uniref:Rab11 family-interacting protein 4A-like isoform X1 n=1 Tax=Lates japonicus TaxID=270547 RepID=A0AAD3R9Z8_LATJO|nr:rab11 family-interacting protein 4A-like isoform X1 [Lates japonicus]